MKFGFRTAVSVMVTKIKISYLEVLEVMLWVVYMSRNRTLCGRGMLLKSGF